MTPTNATGSLPDVVPFDSISGWPGDFVWATAGVEIPAHLLATTGNLGALHQAFPYIYAMLDFVSANTQGSLIRWGPYGDWLAPSAVDSLFTENLYVVRAALQAAEMASALGLADKAAALLAFSAQVDSALVAAFFSPAQGVWTARGGMNAQAMALAVGLGGNATSGATGSISAAMLADAAARGFHTTSGLASSRWILQGLHLAKASAALAMAAL